MEEKLLKYYSISPFLFDKEKCDKYTISQIIKILHNAQYNGFLFVYNEKKWYDHIIDFIKYLKELDKNEQEKRGISKVLLNNLEMEIHYKNKNLLKKCIELKDLNYDIFEDEDKWIEVSKKLHVDKIFSSKKTNYTYEIDDLNGDIGKKCAKPADISIEKTSKNLSKIFENILVSASSIKIIDPYFYIDQDKSFRPLEQIIDILDKNKTTNIYINCYVRYNKLDYKKINMIQNTELKAKEKEKQKQEQTQKAVKNMQKSINELKKYTHVNITIYFWDAENYNDNHERYLITNKIGIKSGAGFDDYDDGNVAVKSNISIISEERRRELDKIFPNTNPKNENFEELGLKIIETIKPKII